MKTFKVTIKYLGLTGEYLSDVVVTARDKKSAEKKAQKTIGNRDGWTVACVEVK